MAYGGCYHIFVGLEETGDPVADLREVVARKRPAAGFLQNND